MSSNDDWSLKGCLKEIDMSSILGELNNVQALHIWKMYEESVIETLRKKLIEDLCEHCWCDDKKSIMKINNVLCPNCPQKKAQGLITTKVKLCFHCMKINKRFGVKG